MIRLEVVWSPRSEMTTVPPLSLHSHIRVISTWCSLTCHRWWSCRCSSRTRSWGWGWEGRRGWCRWGWWWSPSQCTSHLVPVSLSWAEWLQDTFCALDEAWCWPEHGEIIYVCLQARADLATVPARISDHHRLQHQPPLIRVQSVLNLEQYHHHSVMLGYYQLSQCSPMMGAQKNHQYVIFWHTILC